MAAAWQAWRTPWGASRRRSTGHVAGGQSGPCYSEELRSAGEMASATMGT
jgi:hypothetical protein